MSERSSFFRVILVILTGLLLVALAFGSGFVVASFSSPKLRPKPSVAAPLSGSLSLFQEAWDLVESDFYGSLPSNKERVYGAVRGLLDTLQDPYTVFVEPIPHQFEQDDLRGSYGGVGMALNRDADGQVTLSPFRDSPAAKAGILEGDVLLAVDDLTLTPEMDLTNDIVSRIRGEVGTEVILIIRRGEKTLTFTLTRQVIEVPSVTWDMLEQTPTLGYIGISGFTHRTSDELQQGLGELLADGAQGLVLDLRNNGGGLLQSAIDVADQFLDGGVVLYEQKRGQEEKTFSADSGGTALEIPLVILVNHGTASASEIVAGAIQDRGRGILVGETTFGKGSVQLIFELSDGSSLHVTSARWYTPNRHQLDNVGLTPDLVVEADSDEVTDLQLERAVEYLQSQN